MKTRSLKVIRDLTAYTWDLQERRIPALAILRDFRVGYGHEGPLPRNPEVASFHYDGQIHFNLAYEILDHAQVIEEAANFSQISNPEVPLECGQCSRLWDEYAAADRDYVTTENYLKLVNLEPAQREGESLPRILSATGETRDMLRRAFYQHRQLAHGKITAANCSTAADADQRRGNA
jgi:hypothetical protein